jgi:hypothetical protein
METRSSRSPCVPVATRRAATPHLFLAPAFALTIATACTGDGEARGAEVVRELRGDTVVLVSSGEAERVRVATVEIFWQSDEFEGLVPIMSRVGDHLVIGDNRRVHVISLDGVNTHTFGRSGGGPGEFTFIGSVGEIGRDIIGVFDEGTRRVTLFSLDGQVIATHRLTLPQPFVNSVGPTTNMGPDRVVLPLVTFQGGVVMERAASYAEGDTQLQKALVWFDLEADTSTVVGTWAYRNNFDVEYVEGMRFFDFREVFVNLVVHGLGRDGRVAAGDPADYCVRLFRAFEEGAAMGCRERSRVPVETGFHTFPPEMQVDSNPNFGPLRDRWEPRTRRTTHLPHFDRLLFSESGDLWVRLYHEEFAHVHPLSRLFAWEPELREWEVLDAEGALVRHVTVPGTFDLQVIGDDEAFGFLTLDFGEVVVGRIPLDKSAARRDEQP